MTQFRDDWELPRAVLFPSERGGPIGGDTFARAPSEAAAAHLRGPVTKLTPHVLRPACASRLYGEGIGLAAIQQLLGHRWLSTTVRYVHDSDSSPAASAATTWGWAPYRRAHEVWLVSRDTWDSAGEAAGLSR